MDTRTAIISLISAIVGGLLSTGVQLWTSSRQVNVKMIEIAIGILRTEPSAETTVIRQWALRVMNEHASVKFTTAEESVLLKKALPYVPSMDFSDPRNSMYVPML